MPALPGTIALTSIADGSQIVASDHRNNNAAIQTAVNALIAALGDVSAKGDLIVATADDVIARLAVGSNNLFLQADSAQTSGMKWGGAYTAYTPTWTSSGVAPAIGNSTVLARYLQIGKLVHAWGSITFGGTATFGTGNYLFALPVAPSASLTTQVTIGTGDLFDTSATAKASPMWELNSGSNAWMIYPSTWPSGVSAAVSATTPWTWAAGDIITWNLVYEAA